MNNEPNIIVNHNNWKSRSDDNYPKNTIIEIESEEYRQTNTNSTEITPDNFILITKHVSVTNTSVYRRWSWNPHSLLLEDPLSIRQFRQENNRYTFRYQYERLKKQARLIGEIPYEDNQTIIFSSPDSIDKTGHYPYYPRVEKIAQLYINNPTLTRGLRKLSAREIQIHTENQFLHEGEYFLRKGQYNELRIPLTPTFPFRFSKSVYFSHETRYIAKDKNCPKSKISQPVQDLSFIGHPRDRNIIVGKISRGQRTTIVNRQPISILKTRTIKGQRDLEWISRLDNIKRERYTELGAKARSVLYFKLLENQNQLEEFINYIESRKRLLIPPKEYKSTTDSQYYYYCNQIFRQDLLNETIIARAKKRLAANKILNTWRVQVNRQR
jgi:hypothetical protein